jgi:hypothetical protein
MPSAMPSERADSTTQEQPPSNGSAQPAIRRHFELSREVIVPDNIMLLQSVAHEWALRDERSFSYQAFTANATEAVVDYQKRKNLDLTRLSGKATIEYGSRKYPTAFKRGKVNIPVNRPHDWKEAENLAIQFCAG